MLPQPFPPGDWQGAECSGHVTAWSQSPLTPYLTGSSQNQSQEATTRTVHFPYWAVWFQPELLPVAFGTPDLPRSFPEGCACALLLWRTGARGVREATRMNGATLSLLHPHPPLSLSRVDSHTHSEDPFLAVILTGILSKKPCSVASWTVILCWDFLAYSS